MFKLNLQRLLIDTSRCFIESIHYSLHLWSWSMYIPSRTFIIMKIWSDIVSALLTAGSMQHCTNSWTVVFPRLCLLSKLVLLNPSLLAWTRSNALRWYDHSGYRSYVTKLKSTSNIRFFIISPNMSYKFPSESHPDCLRQDLNTPAVTLCVSCHNRWHISSTPQPSYPAPQNSGYTPTLPATSDAAATEGTSKAPREQW